MDALDQSCTLQFDDALVEFRVLTVIDGEG